MSTVTDTDLQQLKDLITAGQLATQQQISELAVSTQKQITDLTLEVRLGFANADTKSAKVEGKIDTVNTELEGIKSNQKCFTFS